jgi:hypothetical protein
MMPSTTDLAAAAQDPEAFLQVHALAMSFRRASCPSWASFSSSYSPFNLPSLSAERFRKTMHVEVENMHDEPRDDISSIRRDLGTLSSQISGQEEKGSELTTRRWA